MSKIIRAEVVGRILEKKGHFCQADLDDYFYMRKCYINVSKLVYISDKFYGKGRVPHSYREVMFENGTFMLLDADLFDCVIMTRS